MTDGQPERSSQGSALAAMIRKYGVLSRQVQAGAQLLYKKGRVEPALKAVVEAIVLEAIRTKDLPVPWMVTSKETSEAVNAKIVQLSEDYRDRGGVLLAKNMVGFYEFTRLMMSLWLTHRPEPIPTTVDLADGKTQEELNARFTLCAQVLLKALERYGSYDQDVLSLPVSQLEKICMTSSRLVYMTFQDPNGYAQRLVEGKEVLDVDGR